MWTIKWSFIKFKIIWLASIVYFLCFACITRSRWGITLVSTKICSVIPIQLFAYVGPNLASVASLIYFHLSHLISCIFYASTYQIGSLIQMWPYIGWSGRLDGSRVSWVTTNLRVTLVVVQMGVGIPKSTSAYFNSNTLKWLSEISKATSLILAYHIITSIQKASIGFNSRQSSIQALKHSRHFIPPFPLLWQASTTFMQAYLLWFPFGFCKVVLLHQQ